MRIFNQAIYKVGPRGNMMCIPFQIIKQLEWVPGDLLYCYPGKNNSLIYTKTASGEMPLGKYIINKNHATCRVSLCKAWMMHNGLQPKDKVNLKLEGKNIVISLIDEKEQKAGGESGEK